MHETKSQKATRHAEIQSNWLTDKNKLNDMYQSGYKAISKAMEQTLVRDIIHETSQEWAAIQNYSKSTVLTHPGLTD